MATSCVVVEDVVDFRLRRNLSVPRHSVTITLSLTRPGNPLRIETLPHPLRSPTETPLVRSKEYTIARNADTSEGQRRRTPSSTTSLLRRTVLTGGSRP